MRHYEKRVWLPYHITEPKQLEKYLEEMAAQGWMPVSVGSYTAKFRKSKPRTLRFCIDFTNVGKKDEEKLRQYTTLCADAGWRFRLQASDGWLLFYSRDQEAEPLQTDPILALKNFKKHFWNAFWGGSGLTLFWIFWNLLDLGVNRGQVTRILSGWNTMLELCCVFLAILLAIYIACNAAGNLKRYFIAKKAIRTGTMEFDLSEQIIHWRIFWRKLFLWLAGISVALSVGYDIWAGNFRPAGEQWAAMGIGFAAVISGFFLKREWLERMARYFAWITGGIFLVLGMILSYPLYRMEPVEFKPDAPVITVRDFMPEAEIHNDRREYGHTPLYERWEVYQSGGVPISENEWDGTSVSYTAYRAATPELAARLLKEEVDTNLTIFHGSTKQLNWPVEEALLLGDCQIVLRDGRGVISCFSWDGPEAYREVLLEQMKKLNN
ncbi:MAG: DUF2812 domain-containing protein [Candidatus Merdivicinus sp.]|jgi:hypothetical protein